MSLRVLWFPLLVTALCAVDPSTADACEPPQPGLTKSIPEDGGIYPGNAKLLFFGNVLATKNVKATVDGQPASLVYDTSLNWLGLSMIIMARVEPAPAKGQTVKLEGDFCLYVEDKCEPKIITYTASEPDEIVPTLPSELSFDLHDYPDFKTSGGDCLNDSDMAWYIRVKGTPPQVGESPVVYVITAFRENTVNDKALTESVFFSEPSMTFPIHRTIDVLDGASPPEALCFQVTALDVAGNENETAIEVCEPCRYRTDPGGASDPPPPEPSWTSADIYPGGPCDESTGAGSPASSSAGTGTGAGGSPSTGEGGDNTGDGPTLKDGGCGCRTATSAESRSSLVATAMALLAGAGWSRRRRRARSSAARGCEGLSVSGHLR